MYDVVRFRDVSNEALLLLHALVLSRESERQVNVRVMAVTLAVFVFKVREVRFYDVPIFQRKPNC